VRMLEHLLPWATVADARALDAALVRLLERYDGMRDPYAAIVLRDEIAVDGVRPPVRRALRTLFATDGYHGASLRVWALDLLNGVRSGPIQPQALGWWPGAPPAEIAHMCTAVHDAGHPTWYKQVYRAHLVNHPPLRVLDHGAAPCTLYCWDENPQWKTTRHFGQRKLFMSEIEFLTLHARPNDTVVYAGAAPGTHLRLLREMFAGLELRFVLVDPAFTRADVDTRSSEGCHIIRDLFEVEGADPNCAASYYRRDDVLFISDIRSNSSTEGRPPSQRDVERDMDLQRRCVDAMRPRAGMLKFRLPWRRVLVPYTRGDLHLPVWGGQRTTECRLVFTQGGVEETRYDAGEYENEMYHFNTVTRVSRYAVPDGGCECYDCAAEMEILGAYVDRFGGDAGAWRDRITRDNPAQDPGAAAGDRGGDDD